MLAQVATTSGIVDRETDVPCKLDDPKANQQNSSQNALKQETYPRPPVGEAGKQSLQNALRSHRMATATGTKRP